MSKAYLPYAAKRLAQAILVILLAYVFTFVVVSILPGDPITNVLRDPQNGFTEAQIDAKVTTTMAEFTLQDVNIIHRIGNIAPGEAIVFVATASAHRREAFRACDLLMDYLKSQAPFWKKEHGPAGARWVEPTEQDLADLRRWD